MAECRRTVLSCARCRRRKIKCDRSIPCGQCVAAKQECTGFSSRDQDPNIPRSIVHHLESEIAKIEAELARNGRWDDFQASEALMSTRTSDIQGAPLFDFNFSKTDEDVRKPSLAISTHTSPILPHNTVRDEIMKCRELHAVIFSILPTGPGITDLVARVRMSLTPSMAVASGSPKDARRKSFSRISNEVSCVMLRSIPTNIIRSLVKKYMSRVYPIYPVLHAPTLWKQLDGVTKSLQALPERHRSVPPSYDFLVIYMMLSVSATLGSAKTGHEARHMMFSGSLFEEGIQHLSERARIPSDLAGLQVILLVLQYASINPRLANVWMLSGAAMRSCLELGLHRETPNAASLDQLTLDLRRRIFWDGNEDAYAEVDSVPSATVSDDGSPFQGKPLEAGQSWEDWLASIERRLRAWYEDYSDGHELTEFTLAHGLTNLHRPSPRMPMPSSRSLMVAFEAACSSAKNLRDHIKDGFYRRSWLIAHHVLENSMVVLFCLRHGFDTISVKFNAQQIFEMTKVFTANFLSLAAQGWNEVSNYAGVFERLLGPLLESVFSNKPPSLSSFGPAQDAELTRMLYPGPAQLDKLRFGSRAFEQDELPAFDVTSLNWEDFSVSDGHSATADYVGGWDLLESVSFGTSHDPNMIYGMV